jgi:hypothetical protein
MNWTFWGHLKAEDFVNLMEGSALNPQHSSHLAACAKCAETLRSVQSLYERIAPSEDETIVEPDWDEFRSGVRGELLSRSVRRERSRQSWFGEIAWKPAVAWGLSITFVVAITSGILTRPGTTSETGPVGVVEDFTNEALNVEAVSSLSRTDVFDELLQLSEDEAASLERLLKEELSGKGVIQ